MRAACVECNEVVGEHYASIVDGKWVCTLCAEKVSPKPAHPAGCACGICAHRRIAEKTAAKTEAWLASRPMSVWPTKRGRGWSST